MATDCVSDSLCVLISDQESSSIATSILFNHALSIGRSIGCSTIIRSEAPKSIPLRLLHSQNYPISLLRKIEFVYVSDRNELIHYITDIYDFSGVPASLIIENLEKYTMSTGIGLVSLLALLRDLGLWIKEKRKCSHFESKLSPVVCSIIIDRSEYSSVIDLVRRYTKTIWSLKDEDGIHILSRSGENILQLKIDNCDVVYV